MRLNLNFEDELKRVGETLASPVGLPNATYTEETFFTFERTQVLARTWAGIGFSSSLAEPGYAIPVDFMGLPVLLVRDRESRVRVFHNVCSHRGMKLVSDEVQIKTVLRCPYHSWSYDFEGKLITTPHVGGMDKHECPGFDRKNHGLREIRSATWMGVIFINLDGEAPPFEDFIQPLSTRWNTFLGDKGLDELRVASTGSHLQLDVKCNWKLPVENYCEAYHLPWLHPALNTYSPLDQHYNITDGNYMSGQGSRRYQPAAVSSEQLPQFPDWPGDRIQHAEYISLYPNVLLGIQADHAFALVLSPLAPNRTRENLQITYVGESALEDRYSACRDSVLHNWNVVFTEDVIAVEGMQMGRQSPGFDGGVFTPVQDVPTQHFHRWLANAYTSSTA